MSNESDELKCLRAENARLIALLESHGIDWRHDPAPSNPSAPPPPEPSNLSTAEKVALFRRLFRGRADVHPVRWESATTGKSDYAPACANEWRPGICEKPRIKCADCGNRSLVPVSDAVIYSHLAGEKTIGVYPLLPDDTCYFLAVDFDKAKWREDAKAFVQSCRELDVPVALEISRSGNGAHAWIFFTTAIPARDARRLGTAIISHACSRTRQLSLTSYDRLFPNQDTMPKGGFGNLIALPLQKKPRDDDHSVFVDGDLGVFPDQWAFLASIESMALQDIEPAIFCATGPMHPLDVRFIDEEDLATPWKRPVADKTTLPKPLPQALTITLATLVYFEKSQLTQPLTNWLIRLATFQNPEFYRAQAMRMSVWDKPRVIGCAENFPQHIVLPRGCLDAAQELLRSNGIRCDIHDERIDGTPVDVEFVGALRPDQEDAVAAMLLYDVGVLCAPTAFGKTVTGATIIARSRVNTLILVHRTELLRQWQERLNAFLGIEKGVVGTIGGGKRKPTGKIDIAVMQSLSRKGEVDALVEGYGQVIVDECHHVVAVSFDAILKSIKARYVLGLTATPIRRDGQQPIIFMQCGPIRHTAAPPAGAPHDLEVVPRTLSQPTSITDDTGIQGIFRTLAEDQERTAAIADEAQRAVADGRKVLVLTERTDHLENIRRSLEEHDLEPFVSGCGRNANAATALWATASRNPRHWKGCNNCSVSNHPRCYLNCIRLRRFEIGMNAAVEKDIQRHRALVAALCRRHGARRLDLFGSATRDDFDAQHSDLDFLVEFEDLKPTQYAQAYFALKEGLERLFERPVDLVTEYNLGNPYFRQRVESERQNLYAL